MKFTIIANISRLESNQEPKLCQNINNDVTNVSFISGLDSFAIFFCIFAIIWQNQALFSAIRKNREYSSFFQLKKAKMRQTS